MNLFLDHVQVGAGGGDPVIFIPWNYSCVLENGSSDSRCELHGVDLELYEPNVGVSAKCSKFVVLFGPLVHGLSGRGPILQGRLVHMPCCEKMCKDTPLLPEMHRWLALGFCRGSLGQ